jgi:hypothetical protein
MSTKSIPPPQTEILQPQMLPVSRELIKAPNPKTTDEKKIGRAYQFALDN